MTKGRVEAKIAITLPGVVYGKAYEEDIARWLQEAAELEAKEEETLPDGRKPQDVAEQKIEQCLRYDSTNADALAAWVGLYVRSGRGPLVMKRLNRIIRDKPEAVGPYRAVAAFMRYRKTNFGRTVFSKSACRRSRDRETDRSFESCRTLRFTGEYGRVA